MLKIDYNAVMKGGYVVEVGNEYELSPEKWGKLKMPTVALQEQVASIVEASADDDLDGAFLKIARLVLGGLASFKDEDEGFGMSQAVVTDFFTLLRQIVERLTTGSEALGQLPSAPETS